MICLDFDGVIADSQDLWLGVLRKTAAYFGVEVPIGDRPFGTLRPLTFEMLGRNLGVEPGDFAEKMASLALAEEEVAPMVAGIGPVLSELSTMTRLTIVSSSRTNVIHRFVDSHRIGAFFCEVVGSGDGRSKAEVLSGYANNGACIMIGDAASDIDAAKSAGLIAIGVTWGWQEAEMLQHADLVVSSPRELAGSVRKIWNSHAMGAQNVRPHTAFSMS